MTGKIPFPAGILMKRFIKIFKLRGYHVFALFFA